MQKYTFDRVTLTGSNSGTYKLSFPDGIKRVRTSHSPLCPGGVSYATAPFEHGTQHTTDTGHKLARQPSFHRRCNLALHDCGTGEECLRAQCAQEGCGRTICIANMRLRPGLTGLTAIRGESRIILSAIESRSSRECSLLCCLSRSSQSSAFRN